MPTSKISFCFSKSPHLLFHRRSRKKGVLSLAVQMLDWDMGNSTHPQETRDKALVAPRRSRQTKSPSYRNIELWRVKVAAASTAARLFTAVESSLLSSLFP